MAFAHSRNIKIHDSTFNDIQGDVNIHTEGDPAKIGIRTLRKAALRGAAYDSVERDPPPKCQPGTRATILGMIHRWIDECERGVYWLHGPAGAGKLAIAQTVAETCAGRGQLAASYFISRSATNRNSISNFFITLALQLASSIPSIHHSIGEAVYSDPSIIDRAPIVQLNELIVEPFKSVYYQPQTTAISRSLIIIDGLDECQRNDDQSKILSYISQIIHTHHLPLRFLVVSRPEPHIRHSFSDPILERISTKMSLLGNHEAEEDVYAYLRKEFDKICRSERHSAKMQFVPKPWPTHDILRILAARSGGYFIYASTVLKYIDEEYHSCIDRLDEVLNASSRSSGAFAELDKLYTQVLSTCPNTSLLVRILGCVFSAGVDEIYRIEAYLRLQPGDLRLALRGLHSIIDIHYDCREREVIYPHHASLQDFIDDRDRAGIYFVEKIICHQDIIFRYMYFIGNWDINKDRPRARDLVTKFPYDLKKRLLLDLVGEAFMVNIIPRAFQMNGWELMIIESEEWQTWDQNEMVAVLLSLITNIESLNTSIQDAMERGRSLLDLALSAHLSPKNPDMIQIVQAEYLICCHIRLSSNLPSIYSRLRDYFNIVYPKGRYFREFMNDPTRCGILYLDPSAYNVRVAHYYIKQLKQHNPDVENVPWADFLFKSPPGDETLMNDLQNPNFPISSYDPFLELRFPSGRRITKEDVGLVVKWLNRMPAPPDDVLQRWRRYVY